MPATVVVGGQYGSEGKGKVAYFLARAEQAAAVVRVGGPNSGHTAVPQSGQPVILRQLPTGALLPKVMCILPSGTYLDLAVLLSEIERVGLGPERLTIDPWASVITEEDREAELAARLPTRIGSTGSGTGKAIQRRIDRAASTSFAKDVSELSRYIRPATESVSELLNDGSRIIVEGTQGFGLSLLHSGQFPFVTSRDTTAAAAISESNISPLYVDRVTLVVRAFPIRVSGRSGPLPGEISWETITSEGEHDHPIRERTSVTQEIRRVARFNPDVVSTAILANKPSSIVLNHLDYLDHECCIIPQPTSPVKEFVSRVEALIQRRIDLWGLGRDILIDRAEAFESLAAGSGRMA